MSNKAVIDGKLQHVSPSQITTFVDAKNGCQRKWWFEKVAGVPPPPPEPDGPLVRGEKIHRQMEDWYTSGIAPEHPSAQELLTKGIPLRTKPGLLVEHPRNYLLGLSASAVSVKGRIDLLDPENTDFVGIVDFKTTSKPAYMKTAEELAQNVQLITYAQWAFNTYQHADSVILTHAYIYTGSVGATVVSTPPLTKDYVNSTYTSIVETPVRSMAEVATCTSSNDVPYNDKACWAWGRACPYLSQCKAARGYTIQAPEPFFAGVQTSTEGVAAMKDELKARKTKSTATPEPTTAATTSTASGFELLIDTCEIKSDASGTNAGRVILSLEEYTAKLNASVSAANGVPDIRCIGFGKGPGLLAAAVLENLPQADLVVGSEGPLTKIVIEALTPYARRVLRPTR